MKCSRMIVAVLPALGLSLLAGCGVVTKESVYEGLNTRERILNPPESVLPGERPMTYPEYEEERKKARGENS